jgi:hypothetical protein
VSAKSSRQTLIGFLTYSRSGRQHLAPEQSRAYLDTTVRLRKPHQEALCYLAQNDEFFHLTDDGHFQELSSQAKQTSN